MELREVCSIHPGQHILESEYSHLEGAIGYLTGPADFGPKRPLVTKWTNQPKAWCEPGDVLVTVKGAGVGKVNLAPDSRVAIGRQLMAIRPRADYADQNFICYVLMTHLSNLQGRALGSTVPGLGREAIDSLDIPLPPFDEQRRIAAALNDQMAAVERARAAAEAQIKAAQALHAAYLRSIFDSLASRLWPRRPLLELSQIVGGVQKSPDRAPVGMHRPYLTVRNVQRGYLDLSEVQRFEVTLGEIERLRLLDGDILIVEGNGSLGHIGRNAMFVSDGQEWVHQNHVIRVRLDRSVARPEFVSRYLNSGPGKAQMVEKAKTTSGLYTLSTGKVASLEVPVPPLPDQAGIIATLDRQFVETDHVRRGVAAQLAVINTLPTALLRRAFAGEL